MQDGVAAQGGRTADVAYDVKGYMTTPARPPGAKGATDRAPVPGVIFCGGNIPGPAQLAGVVAELDQANASPHNPLRHYPLLLMTDQEGGLVRRLPGAPDLSEKQIGESAHPAAAAKTAGRGAGKHLAGSGLNADLAPAREVYRTPGHLDDQYAR